MKNYIRLMAAALCFGTFVLVAQTSSAQTKAAKLEAIAQQLNLTPQQKAKVLPILADEAPKVQAIKNDNSLSKTQKIQQIKAIHRQTDPQMKAILSPEQYQSYRGFANRRSKTPFRAASSDPIHASKLDQWFDQPVECVLIV